MARTSARPSQDEETGAALFQNLASCGSSGNVQNVLIDKCNGKMQCSFTANAEVLGDQGCPGTFKYLEASYTCQVTDYGQDGVVGGGYA